MKKKILYIILIILLTINFGCKLEENKFFNNKKFIGVHTETKWTYNFNSNGKYRLTSEGHGGGNPKNGIYTLKDSTIILLAETEDFEDWKYKRFVVDEKEKCIRDYWGNHYCESENKSIELSEKRFKEILLLEDKIEKLNLVLEKRKELVNQDSTKRYTFKNKGIIIEDGHEYYKYELESWLTEFNRNQVHLKLYVKYNPIRIFDNKFNQINE